MFQLEEIITYILNFKLIKKTNLEIYYAFYHIIRLDGYNKGRLFKKLEENLDVVLNILKFRRSDEIFSRVLDIYNKNANNRLGSPKKE